MNAQDIVLPHPHVLRDKIVARVMKIFDIHSLQDHTNVSVRVPQLPETFAVGLVVGSSGSGKTTLVKQWRDTQGFKLAKAKVNWDDRKAVVSHFASEDEAIAKFNGVGLNSIKAWLRPYDALSGGERARADMARQLKSSTIFDEFTSNIDRVSACTMCNALGKYIRREGLQRIIMCGVNEDIVPYLAADWVYNTDSKQFIACKGAEINKPRFSVAWSRTAVRNELSHCTVVPKLHLTIAPVKKDAWDDFKPFHYLSGDILSNSWTFCAYIQIGEQRERRRCAFIAVAPLPMALHQGRKAAREHRLVVLPAFQGLGLGNIISDAVAKNITKLGYNYYAITSHPALGEYRNRHPELWSPLPRNQTKGTRATPVRNHDGGYTWAMEGDRIIYSHKLLVPEYKGKHGVIPRA